MSSSALSPEHLNLLLGKGAPSLWLDTKGGTCLAPWEGLLLSLLLGRQSSLASVDIAIAVAVARTISLPWEALRERQPVLEFLKGTQWTYAPTAPPSGTPDQTHWVSVCQVLAHPLTPVGIGVRARLGYLPPAQELQQGATDFLLGAVSGDQLDLFHYCSTHLQDPNTFWQNRPVEWKRDLLIALSRSTASVRSSGFLASIPIQGFIRDLEAKSCLISIARSSILFELLCEAFTEQGADLQEMAARTGPLPIPAFKVALKYYNPRLDSKRAMRFRDVLRASLEGATAWHERCLQLRVTDVLQDEIVAATLLDDCCFMSTGLDRLKFLLEECPAIGFDIRNVTRLFIQQGRILRSQFRSLKYLFSVHLGLAKTKELLSPKDLLIFFQTQEAMQYAFEELGHPVPDPTSVECEELLMDALTYHNSLDSALYLFLQCQPELSDTAQAKCLEQICADAWNLPDKTVTELLEYFIERGWLTKGFRFANGDGLQHRLSLSAALPPSDCSDTSSIRPALVNLLRNTPQLDFAEVSPSGEFPISVVLQRGAWQDAQYLLREGLIPPKDVLLNYRHRESGGAVETLVTLLFSGRAVQFVPPEVRQRPVGFTPLKPYQLVWRQVFREIPPPADLTSFYIELCKGIGEDVIQELAKVEYQCTLPGGSTEGLIPPFAFACSSWPLHAVEYLVVDLKV
jgi:hypothetical protein